MLGDGSGPGRRESGACGSAQADSTVPVVRERRGILGEDAAAPRGVSLRDEGGPRPIAGAFPLGYYVSNHRGPFPYPAQLAGVTRRRPPYRVPFHWPGRIKLRSIGGAIRRRGAVYWLSKEVTPDQSELRQGDLRALARVHAEGYPADGCRSDKMETPIDRLWIFAR